jgi:hypothetical protein
MENGDYTERAPNCTAQRSGLCFIGFAEPRPVGADTGIQRKSNSEKSGYVMHPVATAPGSAIATHTRQ